MKKIIVLYRLLLTRLPETLMAIYYAGRRQRLGPRVMDPKAQAVGIFANTLRVPGEIPVVEVTRAQVRQITKIFDEPCPALAKKSDFTVGGGAGDLAARLYCDTAEPAGLPILIYFHGGGWVQGDLETHDGIAGKLAKWSSCIVIAVDYRLAPEDPFPAAIEDGLAAYRWVREHATELGGDPARVGVSGDSAGATLSAVICQQTAPEGRPALQALIYPASDARMDTPSIRELEDAYIIPLDRMLWYRETYLAGFEDLEDLRLSPLLAPDLSAQPKTYVVTAGFDPLRDEGEAYAEALKTAGNDVTQREFPGQIHAFVSLTKVIPQGNECIREVAGWLRGAW